MKILGLSNYSRKEDQFRRELIAILRDELGYPGHLILTEKKLSDLPFLKKQSTAPNRRLDILVVGKAPSGEYAPLLLIECKAAAITQKAIDQVVGYNHFIHAPYISLASPSQILTGWYRRDINQYEFSEGLPHFQLFSGNLCKNKSS
jgi:hypothetical protein